MVASIIGPACDEVIVTKPDVPRGLDPKVLAQEVGKYAPKVEVIPEVGRLWRRPWRKLSRRTRYYVAVLFTWPEQPGRTFGKGLA